MMSLKDLLATWDQHGPRIRGTLRRKGVGRHDLPDVEQEARLRLVYAVRDGELPDPRNLLSWFVTIAFRVWIDSCGSGDRIQFPRRSGWRGWMAEFRRDLAVDPAVEAADREVEEKRSRDLRRPLSRWIGRSG